MTSATRINWGLFQLKSIMPPSNVAACQSYIGWDHLNPTWKLHYGFVKDEIERPLRHLVLSQLGVSQHNNNILIAYGTITWATIYDKFFSWVFTHYLTNMSWGRIDIHTNWLAYFHSWIVEVLLIGVPKWFLPGMYMSNLNMYVGFMWSFSVILDTSIWMQIVW